MRKTWIAALLLASATAVPAYAQDQDHGGQDGGGRHQGSPENGQHVGGGAHQGGNPGGQPQRAQPAQQQQQRPQPGQQQGRPGGGDFGQRGPGGPGGPGGQGGMRPQPGVNGGGRPQGGDARQYSGHQQGGVQVWQGQNSRDDHGRPGPNGGQPGRDGNGQRHDGGQNWNGGRPDAGRPDGGRPNGGQGWNGGRPGGGNAGWNGNRQGGGDWNRGWRQDNRYNWQGYRSQHRDLFRADRYRPPYGAGWGYRPFSVGSRLDSVFFGQDYWIANPAYYRLPPAYGPYRWVRYYNDALLIDLRDGQVVDAISGFFY